MVHLNECPLCSSDKINFHLRTRDHLTGGPEFDLFRCAVCSFVFTQEHPDEHEIEKFYNSARYIPHDNKAGGFYNRIYLLVRYFMLKKKKKLVETTTSLSNGRLLDVGSGTGYFAGCMKKAGWQVTGMEPNNKARNYSIDRFDLNMVTPGQMTYLPENHFDCITLWHVLEHFHKPFEQIDRLKRLLKQGGFMIVALPNSNSFDAQYYKNQWAAYDVPRHLWHFTPSSFRLFSEQSGMEITEVKSLHPDVFYISILSEKNKGSVLPFIRGVAIGLWFLLRAVLRKDKCSSLIYILRK